MAFQTICKITKINYTNNKCFVAFIITTVIARNDNDNNNDKINANNDDVHIIGIYTISVSTSLTY